MSDHDALLAAVIADPGDDLPRLAYADWCDENRDPDRAAFIRAQIQLARTPDAKDLARAADALLRKHRDAWAAPLKECGLGPPRYERGFAHKIGILDEALFADHHARAAALAPLKEIVFEFDFDARGDGESSGGPMEHMLASPAAGLITRIEMGEPEGLPLLADFLDCPRLDGLTSLQAVCLTDDGGAEVARLIAAATQVRRLRSLTLWAFDLGDEGLTALAGAPHLASLEELDIGDQEGGNSYGIGPVGVRAITSSPSLSGLRVLNLCGNRVSDISAAMIANAPLPKLETLHLCGCGLTEVGLRALAGSKTLKGLKTLTLDLMNLTLPTVEEVIASPVTGGLDFLYLGTQGRPGDSARGEALFRLHFGEEVYARLKAHFGGRVSCEQIEWYP